ncbi:hypothetical protein FB451DRAFT_1567107 [Mycena latifolia]|nr:hypothetical protein FB451DRAFT_1567107 [Mycena latifolia]
MFAFKIVASLAVLLVAAVNASPADVAARQEQGFACNADGTDIEARAGFGSHSILGAARYLNVSKDKNSLGAIWRSYFDPLPNPYLALDFDEQRDLQKKREHLQHCVEFPATETVGLALALKPVCFNSSSLACC